jgi:hypothetical protein
MEALERGLNIFFIDGSSLKVAFPQQTDDPDKRKMLVEEIIAKRVLTIEAEGAMHLIPFDNVKYMSVYPAPKDPLPGTIQGAKVTA